LTAQNQSRHEEFRNHCQIDGGALLPSRVPQGVETSGRSRRDFEKIAKPARLVDDRGHHLVLALGR
jgi:hypothetical protein